VTTAPSDTAGRSAVRGIVHSFLQKYYTSIIASKRQTFMAGLRRGVALAQAGYPVRLASAATAAINSAGSIGLAR
jgi:hypothetical protein